jgi:hypothetical protein
MKQQVAGGMYNEELLLTAKDEEDEIGWVCRTYGR